MTPLQKLMHETVCLPAKLSACLCGAYARVASQEIERLREPLDELTSALADARRRFAAGDPNAIQSNMLAATERQALAALAPDSAPEGT